MALGNFKEAELDEIYAQLVRTKSIGSGGKLVLQGYNYKTGLKLKIQDNGSGIITATLETRNGQKREIARETHGAAGRSSSIDIAFSRIVNTVRKNIGTEAEKLNY